MKLTKKKSVGLSMELRLLQQSKKCVSNNPKAMIPEVNLLREYRSVQMRLGRIPTINDMQEHAKYDVSTYVRRYGSWSNFRAICHNPITEKKLSTEQLIENYYFVKERLGRIPTGTELGKYGQFGVRTYHKYFGGHNQLLKLLGEK
jgi:hypothetical protein